MNFFTLLVVCLLVLPAHSQNLDSSLSDFATDYCSLIPEGTRHQPDLWKDCCVVHDAFYWMGGTIKERYEADFHLRQCVRSRTTELNSILIYLGVWIGGSPVFPTTFRWGFGWKGKPLYFALTPEEKDEVVEKLTRSTILSNLQLYEIEEMRKLP